MKNVEGVIQVISVYPGAFGGAVFTGRLQGQRKILVCEASYKLILRTPISGETWFVKGIITKCEDYKNKAKLTDCNIVSLPEAAYVERLLKTHSGFRGFGLGDGKIDKLITEFGAENLCQTLNAGRHSFLSEVINPHIAHNLLSSWELLKNETETVAFLMKHKFTPALSKFVLKVAKKNTVERIEANPYSLIPFSSIQKDIWSLVEAVAEKLSIKEHDPRRLVGCLDFILHERFSDGHTAIKYQDLIIELNSILKNNEFAHSSVDLALDRRVACTFNRDDVIYIQPIGAAVIEAQVEKALRKLIVTQNSLFQSESVIRDVLEDYANEFQENNKYPLTKDQSNSVIMALSNNISIITGFGGTGKTTALKGLYTVANKLNRKVYIMALSGKAKERAKEASGSDETFTIHNFINIIKSKSNILNEYPVLIIDEASMVDIVLANKLLSVFRKTPFSIVLIGDSAQLSPVGAGLFWHKLINNKKIPITKLTKVLRTSEDSELHKTAMKCRGGEPVDLPEWRGELEGVFLISSNGTKKDLHKKLYSIVSEYKETLILTPHASTMMIDSSVSINQSVQYANEYGLEERIPCITMGQSRLIEGDPVIVTNNCYEYGLFNGNTGRLTKVFIESERLYGEFIFNKMTYTLSHDQCWELGMQPAFAVTIHKSQGSEYDNVAICAVKDSNLLERSMIYTALTRAKKLCIFVGELSVINRAIAKKNRADTICVGLNV